MNRKTPFVTPDSATAPLYPFSVTVVIPAYNEEHGIAAVIARVREALPEAEIMVVDDASSDATEAQAAAAGARVERHPANRGNGAAVKTGIRRATGEVVLLMDADGQMNPRYIPAILGGIGSVPGAMAGGLIIGIAEAAAVPIAGAQYRAAVAFLVLLAVLLVKPTGLFGVRER